MYSTKTHSTAFARKIFAAILTAALPLTLINALSIPAQAESLGTVIDLSDAAPQTSGDGWTYASNVYTISTAADVTVTGNNSGSQRRVAVAANAKNVKVTLDSATISGLGTGQPALRLNNGADVTLTIAGVSTLTGGVECAGIQTTGATIAIYGDGTLAATGGSNGAGIGGGLSGAGGNIFIRGGTITARGGNYSAGIGGGGGWTSKVNSSGGAGGNITISGGLVTANAGTNAAGIGGGSGYYSASPGGNITINGGTVTATGSYVSGIGGGRSSNSAKIQASGGTVVINGGSVKGTIQSRPKNSGNTDVYLISLTVSGVNNATIDTAAIREAPYGVKDVKTDGNKLYFFLAQNAAASVGVVAGGTLYANDAVNVNGDTAAATLTAVIGDPDSQALYTVTYDGNGGTGAPAAASYLMGTSVRVEGLGNMKKNGYAFGGWTIASGNLSDTVQPNNIFPMPAAAVRLTAVWNQKILSLVDSQTGTLIYGTADSATYGVTTENIASAAYPVTLINAPEGVTASNIAVNSSGSGVLTLNSSASTPAGTYSGITAKVDDAESEAFALTVAPKLITESMIAAIPAQTYTGEQLTPEPAVTNGAAPALEKGADFDYSYNSNTNVGQASVTVTGKGGNYTGAAAQTFEIQKPGTTVELAAEPEQDAVYGDTLALSVRVLGENGSIPRGFVRLWDDYQQIGGETVLSDGRAKIAMPALSAGGHNFAVAYINSDGNHKDYSSDGNGYSELNSYNVAKAPTAVALTAETEASAVYGSSVALTAVISGGMNPSSTVTFFDGETQIGETAAVADGRAEKEILGLSAGSHTFRAEYSGDGNHNGSQGTLYGFNIEKAAQAALTVENPSEITYGSPEFKLTASGGSGDGGVTFAAADNGVLSVAADGSVTILGAGSVWVTATKASDSNYNQASSVPLEIIVHPRDIARNEVIVEVAGDRTYTGEQLAPSIEVTDSSAAITVGDWAAEWGENVSVAGGGSVTIRGQGNYAGQKTQSFDIEKAAPGYTAPDNLRATVGRTLADVKLPEHFSWEDDTSTLVGDAGKRIFLAAYTPPDSENYNVVSGIEVIVTVIRPHYPQFGNESGSDATPEPSATDATPEPEPMPDESSTPDESTSPDEDPAPDESPSPKPPKSGGALDAFTDIPMDAWYYADVEWVVSKGLFYGTSGSTFSPNAPMTRAMMITVLARDAGIDANGGATWYEKALNWGVSTGLTDGTNPNSPITREQLATLLYRYAKSPSVGGNLAAFSDVSDYAKDAMAWAVATGLLVGRTTATLAPKDDATRAEVAAILHRFFEEAAPAA